MIMTIWCLILTAIVVVQGIQIAKICDCLEKIKSWKPFIELCGIQVPREYMRANKKGGEK